VALDFEGRRDFLTWWSECFKSDRLGRTIK
jgi:hypothetical protein